jgi:hypothetical protein
MIQPTISVRQLDANHDPLWGNNQNNLIIDLQAVAQIIETSLLLFQGEWWENLKEGLPLFQSILGSNNGKKEDAVALIINTRILGVPYVLSIFNIVTTYSTSRLFTYTSYVNTQFGVLQITFTPGLAATIPAATSGG